MGQITDNAKVVYAAGPSSAPTEPNKSDIVSLFYLIEALLGTVVNGLVIGNAVVYATRAALFADLARPANTLGIVYNDSTPAYNGIYVKAGASGTGSWSLTTLLLPSSFAADLAAVISDLASEVADRTVTTDEVVAARGGEASLANHLEVIKDDLQTEVENRQADVAAETSRASKAELEIPSVGDLFSRASPSGQVQNGATAIITGMGQRMVGFSIPAGFSGQNSFVTMPLPITKEDILALAGKRIDIVYTATASPNFETVHPLANVGVTVFRAGAGVQDGTLVSSSQDEDTLTRVSRYLVDGTEDVIAVSFVVAGAITAGIGVELRVSGLTYRVVDDTTDSALGVGGSTWRGVRADNASEHVSVEVPFSSVEFTGESFSGGLLVMDQAGRFTGINVPAGEQGDNTYISAEWTPDNSELLLLRGARVRLYMDFDVIGTLSVKVDSHLKYVTPSSSAPPDDETVLVNKVVRDGLYRAICEGTLPVDLVKVRGTFQIDPFAGTGAAPSDQTIRVRSISYRVLAPFGGIVGVNSGNLKETPADINARLNTAQDVRRARRLSAADNTTQAAAIDDFVSVPDTFSTIAAAVNALTDAGDLKRYRISVAPGIYTDFDWYAREQVEIGGIEGRAVVSAAQPDNAALLDIEVKSAINVTAETWISGLRVNATNLRYALHCDFQNAKVKAKAVFEDCIFIHLGNDGAKEYQTAIGSDPNAVWGGCCAIGFGPKDGGEQVFRRVSAQGYKFHGAVGHSFKGAKSPTKVLFDHSSISAGEGDFFSILWRQVGSGQQDVIETTNNVLNAPIAMTAWPWLPAEPEWQVANKTNVVWTGSGNSPAPYLWDDEGSRALRIDAAADNVGITLTGSAVAVLFGDVVPVRPALGLPGGAYGKWDVGTHAPGTADNSPNMAARLGDRTSAPITLTVTPSTGSPVIVTLGGNYTGQSNATILATINSALGSSFVASYMDVNELFRPTFTDEEKVLRNTGTTTIRRKHGVAYDGDWGSCRLMVAADAATLFAGIAYEDIRPGESGRVKSGGMVRVAQDVIRSDGGAFAFGDTFGIGVTPGHFAVGATVPLMRAVSSRDVLVGG